jgi:hypothetical protein
MDLTIDLVVIVFSVVVSIFSVWLFIEKRIEKVEIKVLEVSSNLQDHRENVAKYYVKQDELHQLRKSVEDGFHDLRSLIISLIRDKA